MKIKENFVEEWSKEFDKSQKEHLSQKDAKMLIYILINEKELNKDQEVLDLLKENNTMHAVLWHRLKNYPINVSPTVVFFLGNIVKSFGISTMMTAMIVAKAAQYETDNIDIHFLCNKIIPFGFPTEREFDRLWKLQKIDSKDREGQEFHDFIPDNFLDYSDSYKSLLDKLNKVNNDTED